MLTPIDEYNKKAKKLFDALIRDNSNSLPKKTALYIVTHMFPDRPAILGALKRRFNILGVFIKQKNIDYEVVRKVTNEIGIPILNEPRERLNDPLFLKSLIAKVPSDHSLAILDIGGYFAPHLKAFEELGDRFLGVVEDTENGHQKYENVELGCLVYSAARSPLKEPEDFLVGRSIVFSAEHVLRKNNDLLMNKDVLVIGYGKIGKSIAAAIASRNVAVSVFDTDPIKMAQARSHGFKVGDRKSLLKSADAVFAATGNSSLSCTDFDGLKNGVFLFSCTSADDEFGDLYGNSEYTNEPNDDRLEIFRKENKRSNAIFLVNKGNAVNFLHNAVVGPYIYLVQSELVLSLFKLSEARTFGKLAELSSKDRSALASRWLAVFN